jgi:hypothetical protein
MKYYFVYFIAFLAVLLLFMLSLGCTCAMGAVPYSSDATYASYVEGFSSSSLNPSFLDGNNPQFSGSYSRNTENNLLDSIQQQITTLTTTSPTEAIHEQQHPTESAEGFSLSEASNFSTENVPIDHYSQLPGSLTCDGYGYYNSLGNICMDATGRQMLQTRGGNQTGASSQIGMSSA